MTTLELFLLSVGLAMDAFAVSICKGLCMKKMSWKKASIIAIFFGAFQAIMPILGYYASIRFEKSINQYSHIISFILLMAIGINMIKEAKNTKDGEKINDLVDAKTMFLLAIATSIDALAVGVTMAFLNINILKASLIIGIITFVLSFIGVKIGNIFGDKYERKAQIVGGIILILIGTKILL